MKKATVTREEVICAIKAAARRLRRTPTREEFMRMSKIHWTKVQRLFGGYRVAVRAAGLEPDRVGLRIETGAMLEDWGRVAREMGRHPTRNEYEERGRFASASLETRFHRWSEVRQRYLEFVQANGMERKWGDVVENLVRGPVPRRGGGKAWMKTSGDRVRARADEAIAILPPLRGMQRVSLRYLWMMFWDGNPGLRSGKDIAGLKPSLIEDCFGERVEATLSVPRRVFAGRPLMGAPMRLRGMAREPVNEMGVVCLFALLAPRLGFEIEALQAGYPDCLAKWEVEPGKWQGVRIEFEFESRKFREHRHDPEQCDIIVCWRHNWKSCPKHIVVIELSKVIG